MIKSSRLTSTLLLSFAAFACSSNSVEPGTDDGSGGMVGQVASGGTVGSGGGLASGGSVAGSSGGSTASGGSLSDGSGGAATGGNGSGGEDSGETGSGGGTVVAEANPSPGCSKGTARPQGGTIYKAGESWLIFPEKYDGTTPLPVLFGFHGCGSGNKGNAQRTEFLDLTRNSGFEDNYVVAAPLSISDGGCYDQAGDMARAKQLYTDLVENYCVDLDRVFATGHSYGSGFLMGMTGNKADFDHFGWAGIAPVSGWKINNQSVLVPTMYIQGIQDSERKVNGVASDGAEVVEKIVEVNECSMTSKAYAVDACNSNHDQAPVDAGCKEYDECGVRTIWCRHDDSDYGGTFHGVPCFYRQAVYDFFESL